MKNFKRIFLTMLGFICFGSLVAQHPSLQIKDGKVNYLIDERGNRVLDYSYCGYKSSGQDIPVVKNVVLFLGKREIILCESKRPLIMHLH